MLSGAAAAVGGVEEMWEPHAAHPSVAAVAMRRCIAVILYSIRSRYSRSPIGRSVAHTPPHPHTHTRTHTLTHLRTGHFLFVAYDAVIPGVTALPVGLLKAYFLATTPPTELVLTVRGYDGGAGS